MKKPSLALSIAGIGGLFALLLTGILVFHIDIVLLLILGIIYITAISRLNGGTFRDVLEGMKQGCSEAFVGLLFFLLIGAIIGIWVQAGTVPALVYYGLNLLSPRYFLITSFVICSIVSAIVGTSWGTVGTVGIAIMGVATSSGISIPIYVVAGSIVSGAWFGDKMSPVSDSTVLTATACNTEVYDHIKSMCYTTLPSYVVSLGIFIFINWHYSQNITLDTAAISEIQSVIHTHYNMGPLVFLPALLLLVLCILKIDAIITLVSVIGMGVVCSVVVQGNSITAAFDAIMSGVKADTANQAVDVLLNRGGITSMMPTFLLGFMALCLGGVLQKMGFFHVLVEKVTRKLNNVFSLVLTTMATCALGNAVFGDTYLSIVLNANMYKEAYEERGLHSSMLSRTIEEAATMFTPLIPWTAASAFIMGALGVPTVDYAAFAVLNLVNPTLSLLFAGLGIGVIRKK